MNKTGSSLPKFSIMLACVLAALLAISGCTMVQQPTPGSIHVSIQVDGQQVNLDSTPGATVQSVLQQAGITLGNLDRVTPPSYTVLADNNAILITRVKEVFTVKENIIPFEHQTVHNESLPEGQTLLVQRGVNGAEQVTYRQVLEDDKEISNEIFKSETVTEPLPEIVMVGVQKPFSPVTIPGKLVYIAGGNAWLMESSTGERRPVVTSGDLDGRIFSLSPKGDWLLFTRSEKPQASPSEPAVSTPESPLAKINSLWAIDLTEADARPVSLKVDNVINFAGWVPGKGLTILYSTVEPRATAPGWQANNDLQMLTFAATGTVAKQDKIIETNAGGMYGWWGTAFAFSADGAYLAYARPDSIGLVDLQKKALVPLVDLLPFQTGSDWAWVPGVTWSPDHNVLFMVTHQPKAGMEPKEASPVFDLAGFPFGKDPLTQSGPLIDMISQVGMFAYPVTSPKISDQGYNLAYLHAIFPEQSDTKRYRLAVMDRDGSNRALIFPPENYQGLDPQIVHWSPAALSNGTFWLAVNYQGNLWLVNSETGDSQQITGDGLICRPSCMDWK